MMRGDTWLCDNLKAPGCAGEAASTFICHVEGRQVALCGPCHTAWRTYARSIPGLEHRCPNCAPQFVANLELARSARHLNSPDEEPVLTGPLADLIERAMATQGVLVDVRTRVLRALYREATGGDSYSAMLLRSTAQSAVV